MIDLAGKAAHLGIDPGSFLLSDDPTLFMILQAVVENAEKHAVLTANYQANRIAFEVSKLLK